MNRAVVQAFASLVLVALLLGIPVASATAAAPPTQVDSCRSIDEPGRYVLTGNVTNSSADRCLRIRANDVVLDGQGHTVEAGGAAAVAVNASGPLANVTVRDVRVTGADEGVEVDTAVDTRVIGVEAEGNGVGIGFHGTRTGVIRDSTLAANDAAGVRIRGGTATLVENVTTRGNTLASSGDPAGIALHDTTDATVRNSDIAEEYDGIALENADGTHVVGNAVRSSNSGVAVLDGSSGNVVRDNAFQRARVVLEVRDDAVEMADNVVAGNDMERSAVSGSALARNLTVRNNELDGGPGISVGGADSNVSGNVVRGAGGAGIDVGGADAVVHENRVTGADGAGIHVRPGGDGVRLEGNAVVENGGHGVALGAINRPEVTDVLLRNTYARGNGGHSFHAASDSRATALNFSVATATVDFGARSAAFEPLDDPPAPPEEMGGVDQYLRTVETSDDGHLDLRFHYDQAAVGDLEESTLRLYGHDGEWQKLESQVDAENDTVTGTIGAFGVVGVLGRTEAAAATPTATTTATATAAEGTPTEGTPTEDDEVINPTVRPGWTPSPSPTPTESPTPSPTPTPNETATPTTTSQPGFGVAGVLVALLALACAFVRRTG